MHYTTDVSAYTVKSGAVILEYFHIFGISTLPSLTNDKKNGK